jgi:CSLREA domain-containing protein
LTQEKTMPLHLIRILGLAFVFALLVFLPGQAVAGGTLFVTRADDPAPNGCQAGDCSLREAIIAANVSLAHKTIVLPGTMLNLEQAGAGEDASVTGDLDINSNTTILGNGSMVDGHGLDRVFHIGPQVTESVTVTLENLTVRGGDAGGTDGGGIHLGGAAGSTLILNNVEARDNSASNGGGVNVCCGSNAELTDVVISDNSATDDGGGLRFCCTDGTFTMTRTEIYQNSAGADGGGAFFCCGSNATATDIAVHDNSAGDQGGGIYHCCNGGAITDAMIISRAAIYDNVAGLEGGGVYNCCASLTLMMTNATIHGNSAGSKGGGYHNEHSETGLSRLTNLTITANSAPMGAGIFNGDDDNIDLTNSIVANNLIGSDCEGNAPTLSGANIDSDGTCGATTTDPLLGPLADNGGFSQTRATLDGSPALNAGNNSLCPETDQRGIARPQGPQCDIGAFEAESVPTLLWGDNNCDGDIDATDALLAILYVAEQPADTGEDCPGLGEVIDVEDASLHAWGDSNCDEAIDLGDVRDVLRYRAGLEVSQNGDCLAIGDEVILLE